MTHAAAGEPPTAGRRAAPLTTAVYSAEEWDLLTALPGRVVVAATAPSAGRPARGVIEGLAGLAAVAAGRSFDSDLVRAVATAIYARHDGESRGGPDGRPDQTDLLAACRAAARVLARRADPADSAAYRQWVQSVAAGVCRSVPAGGCSTGGSMSPADRRFLDGLGGALGLR